MIDIIDVILARRLSSQGQIESYAALAQKAIEDAGTAVAAVEAAAASIETINETVEAASQALSDANDAISAANEAIESISDSLLTDSDVEYIINNYLNITVSRSVDSSAITTSLNVMYPDEEFDVNEDLITLYKNANGDSNSAGMTQKAIKDFVSSSVKTAKDELIVMINNSGGGGSEGSGSGSGSGGTPTNIGPENAGLVLVVDENGNIIAGSILETSIIEALVKTGTYTLDNAVGVSFDYENKIYEKTQNGDSLTINYNNYAMYGGRMRCNVDDNGTITAWYGDNNYREDGSNGQVMVYQPKFYYQRYPTQIRTTQLGKVIRKESLILSPVKQTGFKIHPIFINEQGEEVDYVLFSAYEGCAQRAGNGEYVLDDAGSLSFNIDKLSSIAGAKPISGWRNSLTPYNAERLARNRGTGWHITNMAFESANQMLLMTEYGSPNSQSCIEMGLCNLSSSSTYNYASITGSTSSLGNTTGAAVSTVQDKNGTQTSYSEVGKRAISYRGLENPWGNLWRMIGGILIVGNGTQNGGIPYICTNYNYASSVTSDYASAGFAIPNLNSWLSAFGYGESTFDWLYLPIESSTSANSSVPIGDNLWVTANLRGTHAVYVGGKNSSQDNAGQFYYAMDEDPTNATASYSCRLMFIPTKNTIYTNNIASWTSKMGG